MKKHPEADALAARLAAAANQPPVVVPFPAAGPSEPEIQTAPPAEPDGKPATTIEEPKRRQRRMAISSEPAAEQPDGDTKAISIRPRRELLKRYVLAAADRTREVGRVFSAQDIMLEFLERGP